jgi:hypothetical protein
MPIRWDIRYQAFVEGNLLKLPRSVANVHHESVDLKHSYQRIIIEMALHGPVWVKLLNSEHLSDRC